ncbi:MAG: HEAT repeat domain-containing protein [Acidobacteriota bacterium]
MDLRSANSCARALAEEEDERIVKLETIRAQAELDAQQRAEVVQQLTDGLDVLRKTEGEIEAAEAARVARDQALQLASAEASRIATEEQKQLAQLEAVAAKQLKSELEFLRKGQPKKVKEIENLEAGRRAAETEARKHAETEAQLLAELEALRVRVAQNELAWPEQELSFKSQFEALRKVEAIQLKRIEMAEVRLHAEPKAALKTKARSTKSEVQSAPKSRTSQRSEAQKQRVALLEAIRSEAQKDIKNRSKKEEQVLAEVQALYKAEVAQLQRIEEAKARLKSKEKTLRAQADEEARLLELTQPSNPEAVSAAENHLETESETSLSLQPLETWQFSLTDEPEVINGLEESLQPVHRAVESVDQTEAHEIQEVLEIDLQVELSRLEAATSPRQSEPEQAEKSIDPVKSEKSLQISESDSATSALVEKLKSGDPGRRAAALQELAQQGEDEAFELITTLFDDRSAAVRNAAALALHEFKPDRAGSFTRALREGSASRRRNIAAALNGSGLAAEAINSLSGEGRGKTYDAFSILFLMAKAGEVQTLLQTIERHPDVAVRLSVIRLLTFCKQPNIIPAFRSLAVRGALPTEVRSAVMEAIYQISSNSRENSLPVA